jgi:hypothetical protein
MRRGLLLVGMGGFLAIALAIPDAFGPAGWVFGVGYMVVNACAHRRVRDGRAERASCVRCAAASRP